MSKRISRATLLKGFAALAVSGIAGKVFGDFAFARTRIPCRMLGPSMSFGHRLRDGGLKLASDPTVRTRVVIAGGGIAGLSAAWWLKRNGFNDFILVELENQVGGNSRSGANQVSAYPWGAHYVPVANAESKYVQMLFEELGVVQGYDAAGRGIYNDLYLCHEPAERLLKDGTFQEGMIPKRGLQPADKADIERFLAHVHKLRDVIGSDGKPAFAIPLDLSSADQEFRKLDRVSFGQWLHDNSYNSKPLLWYLNYCCRDDYGSTVENVSAWAGIHYFAGRRGTPANGEMNAVVTWPEGNGFLVNHLRDKVKDHIRNGTAVARVEQRGGKVVSFCVPAGASPLGSAPAGGQAGSLRSSTFAIESDDVIFAAPRFMAKHIVAGAAGTVPPELAYAPWMVANITVSSMPRSKGVPLAWDNVSYLSNSLGYVVATHQNITTRESSTVLTYYFPLSHTDPVSARKELMTTPAETWSQRIIADLEKMHPGIEDDITSIDLWPWGHGMVRPAVGFMWSDSRQRMKEPVGSVYFAHSDMSGMSNFEEAQYHGIQAAEAILAATEPAGSRRPSKEAT